MIDFGLPELLVIVALAVIVVGPNEIPKVMLGLGRILRRLSYVRYAFTQQFDDFMKEHDLDDIRKSVNFEAPEGGFDEAEADEEYMTPLLKEEEDSKDE